MAVYRKKRIRMWMILTAVVFAAAGVLVLTKKISANPLFAAKYKVQGIDVSHFQGDIDWEILSSQDISFAYIKATEGSSHVDEKFAGNWQDAGQTGLLTGAYHFFSFDSEGSTQAALYIQTVGDLSGRLAPMVDVEYYADKEAHPPGRGDVVPRLRELVAVLEGHYGVKPVIYTTYKVYDRYIAGEFDEYPLWIRNVYYPPDLDKKGKWQFWQYSDTAVMDGYTGQEIYIDRNVFVGSPEELRQYLVPTGGE